MNICLYFLEAEKAGSGDEEGDIQNSDPVARRIRQEFVRSRTLTKNRRSSGRVLFILFML